MRLFIEFIQFLLYSFLIVIISKYILVAVIRKLAESLNLKAKTIGNITGATTSMPEFLSVSFASIAGLIGTSIYNILSSNVINLLQYIVAIKVNKNTNILKNTAIRIDIIMVIFTIIIPIIMIILNIEISGQVIPIYLLLFVLFYYINNNAHNLYLKKEDIKKIKSIEEESKFIKGKKDITIKYSFYLVLTSICLYIIGTLLSNSLENLCKQFFIPQFIIGIFLGFITSIPELITFIESQKHYNNKNNRLGVVEATNNLLTSNILNIFVIQSLGIFLYHIY